jgi:hypothetical protein
MNRRLLCSLAMTIVWTAAMAAQRGKTEPPSAVPPAGPDLTVTGCVVEGTDAGVYVLTNVVTRPDGSDLPKTFRLVSTGEDLDFALHSNHQVQAVGRAEVKATAPRETPPGARIDPRDLPAFSVKSMRSVSDRCVATP